MHHSIYTVYIYLGSRYRKVTWSFMSYSNTEYWDCIVTPVTGHFSGIMLLNQLYELNYKPQLSLSSLDLSSVAYWWTFQICGLWDLYLPSRVSESIPSRQRGQRSTCGHVVVCLVHLRGTKRPSDTDFPPVDPPLCRGGGGGPRGQVTMMCVLWGDAGWSVRPLTSVWS